MGMSYTLYLAEHPGSIAVTLFGFKGSIIAAPLSRSKWATRNLLEQYLRGTFNSNEQQFFMRPIFT
jgi:hypothetical protein